jgi:hypothetical protein
VCVDEQPQAQVLSMNVIKKKPSVRSPSCQPHGLDGFRIPSSAEGFGNQTTDSEVAEGISPSSIPEKSNIQTDLIRKRAITFDTPQSPRARDPENQIQNPSTSYATSTNTTNSEPGAFRDPFNNETDGSLRPIRRTSEMLHPYLSFSPMLGRNSVISLFFSRH